MRRALALGTLLNVASCAAIAGIDGLEIGDAKGLRLPDRDGETEIDGAGEPDSATSPDVTTAKDTSIDSPPAVCALPTNDTFAKPVNAKWALRGSAAFLDPTGASITPDAPSLGGALWWDEVLTFDRIDVTFGFRITSSTASPGDGLTFAWVGSQGVPATPPTGGDLGVRGLTGFALSVDTYTNVEYGDGAVPAIALKNAATMANVATTAAIPALLDGNEHTIRVQLTNGSLTASLDGAVSLGPVAIPQYQAFAGYFGFGAGTGGAQSLHVITKTSARIGTTGPCAAP